MKKIIFLLVISPILVKSQQIDLPDNYYIENNLIKRGGVEIYEGLYSSLMIDTIFLYFDQDDFWDQMLENYCDKINIVGTMLYKNQQFDSVGVRFKGQTSFANTNGSNGGPGGGGPGGNSIESDKKSFNIKLDWIKDQDIDGYETLNLNNCYQDPSFMREFLFENLASNYIPAVKVNFIQLMINDENWGLYPNVQQLDKKHASEWFVNKNCTRWRAEDPNTTSPGCGEGGPGGGPGGGPNFGAGTSSLNFLGSDTLQYFNHYTLKKSYKNNPWEDLVDACYRIDQVENQDPENIYNFLNEKLDLDATLWFLAVEIIFSDDDSYINKGGMDYYVYYDFHNQRILPIEYDANTVFGNVNWGPFYNQNNEDFVLINKLLSIPEIRQRYLAHFRTILSNCFEYDYIETKIDLIKNYINLYVENDPQKIYSYQEFLNEIEIIKEYFLNRSNILWSNNQISISNEIDNINVSQYVNDIVNTSPNSEEEVKITVQLDSEANTNVILYYGLGISGHFDKVEMEYDEINNYYYAIIPPQAQNEIVRYYVEVTVNENYKKYSPEGAEHDVYFYQIETDELTYINSDLTINEFMSKNVSAIIDEFNEFDDWIEIYNNGNEIINLNGFKLSDDSTYLDKFIFPDTSLLPNEYLIVWCDEQTEQGAMHTSFKLSSDGDEIYLSNQNSEILNHVIYSTTEENLGNARVPNGDGDFTEQPSTFSQNNDSIPITFDCIQNGCVFNENNDGLYYHVDLCEKVCAHTNYIENEIIDFNLFPNPNSGHLNIVFNSNYSQNINLSIHNLIGEVIFLEKLRSQEGQFRKAIDLTNKPNGIYILNITTNNKNINQKIVIQ